MSIRKLCLIIMMVSLSLVGCSYETGQINEEYIISLFKSQDNSLVDNLYVNADNNISVPLPQSNTSIYISRLGYKTDDEKKAIFKGKKLGESFKVVNADTKEIVYTGEISGDSVKMGNFSEVSEPGRYYLETDYVGRSYYFNISDDLYTELFLDLLNSFYSGDKAIDKKPEDIIDACVGMNIVIYAMQCNGDIFEVESNIVEQLLYMSDYLVSMQEDGGSILDDYEATAAFCGIISMCGSEFGKYESSIDKTYKESAVKAWEWLEKNDCDTEVKSAARLYAAAQLYNLLKTEQYRIISEKYLNDKGDGYNQTEYDFLGAIAYMNSKSEVDMTLCTYIMMDMMQEADRVCDNVSADKVYSVGTLDIDEVMTDTAWISFFNYLVPSSEYISVLSSALEYIGGYNPEGINYIEECSDDKIYEYRGIVLFAISNILTADE